MKIQTLEPPADAIDAAFERRKALVMRVVELYYCYLLSFVRRFVDYHSAEDVVQELLRYCLLQMRVDLICSLPALRRKAHYLALDHLRKRKRSSEVELKTEVVGDEMIAPIHREPGCSDEDESRLQERFWSEFPIELTDLQRRALWLYGRHGMTVQEISGKMAIPTSTVHDWIKLGRERLHDAMSDKPRHH